MKLKICWIGKTKEPAIRTLTTEYVQRIRHYLPVEPCELRDESSLMESWAKERARPLLVLLDARGRQVSSEELAAFLAEHQERGTPLLMFAVGPADGWSADLWSRTSAGSGNTGQVISLSLGRITMAHEIARVVLLEQIYRAFTILKGHPYHSGH